MKCLYLFFILLLLSACHSEVVFSAKKIFDNDVWTYSDNMSIQIDNKDTIQRYDLLLEVEHSLEYRYQNIYLNIHTKFPDGNTRSQSLSIDFADKIGRWQGKCSSGYCSLPIVLQENIYFNQVGQYELVLEQHTRVDSLLGMSGLQFIVARTKLKG